MKEGYADGGRTGFRRGGAGGGSGPNNSPGTTQSGGNANTSTNQGPAGGASSGGNYGGNRNPNQTYGGGGGKTTTTTTTTPKTNPRGFPTTRTLQPGLFEKINTHFVNNQKLKDAVARGDITQEDYNVLGGFDAKQTLNFGPVTTGITSAAYNTVQSILGDQPFFDGASDVGRNVFGSTLDPNSAYAQQYNKIMNLADGGPARQNFKMGKRAFLKLMGGVGAGIAGLKSGLLGLGKGATKKAVTETVKQTAGSGTPPPYFFKLVEKIKNLGDDAPRLAVKDREKVTTYKDYTLTEDITTGEKTIQRMKIDDDLKYDASEYYGKPVGEETYMNYKPGKGQTDETTGKVADEYTEDTSLIRTDRPAEGEIMETVDGVPDDVLKEIEAGSGNVPESFYTGPNAIKKADGGLAAMLGE